MYSLGSSERLEDKRKVERSTKNARWSDYSLVVA